MIYEDSPKIEYINHNMLEKMKCFTTYIYNIFQEKLNFVL